MENRMRREWTREGVLAQVGGKDGNRSGRSAAGSAGGGGGNK